MRRKADREAQELDVEAQQKAMRGCWTAFRVVIGILVVCAAGALYMALKSN